jgi:hypothetical protein
MTFTPLRLGIRDRWMVEITYNSGKPPMIDVFEEFEDLGHIVKLGPDWHEIEQIVITLNRPSRSPEEEAARRRGGDHLP